MSLLRIIKSYLYVQYNDDPALQAFVNAFNEMAQDYLDTFNHLNLPIYSTAPVEAELLDWVAKGLYGFDRPVLPLTTVDDDLFRRVITWHFFKGDGMVFNTTWLKRRIMRFLFGVDGINFNVEQTYRVSVIMDASQNVAIRVIDNFRTVTGGAFFGRMGFNTTKLEEITSTNVLYPTIPEAALLQQAMQSGVLEVPFQFVFTVAPGGFANFDFS